jgi:DNA topoisomerase-1
MFINVPKRYDLENLTQADLNELTEAKVSKEANRYIHRWDDEKISVENARWGPVIKFGKKIISIPRKADGTRPTADEAAALTLEQVKKLVEAEVPDAFAKRTRRPAKKPSATRVGR